MKNRKTLELSKKIEKLGGGFTDYFKDAGIPEVAIYGDAEMLAFMWHQLAEAKINVKNVYSEEPQKINVKYNGKEGYIETVGIVADSESQIPIIASEPLAVKGRTIYQLNALLTYSLTKRQLLDNLYDYVKYKSKTKVILFALPSFAHVRNKTKEEREQIAAIAGMKKADKNAFLIDVLSTQLKYGPEYAENVISKSDFEIATNEEGVPFYKDVSSKYINIEDGHRVTPANKSGAKRRVYIFGNSVGAGVYTDDKSTISNAAQMVLNEYYQDTNEFMTINCSNGSHPNFDKMWESIAYHQPQNSDVIIVISWFSDLFLDNPYYKERFTFFNPQKEYRVFDRPHGFGKYIWLTNNFYQPAGHKELGKLLGEKVIESQEGDGNSYQLKKLGDVTAINQETNPYWITRDFAKDSFTEFIRKNPLQPKGPSRWLNFEFDQVLEQGKLYQIEMVLKYDESTSFTVFINDGTNIERLPKQTLKAGQWKKVSFFCRPKMSGAQFISFTATDFVSAGRMVCVESITYQDGLTLYD